MAQAALQIDPHVAPRVAAPALELVHAVERAPRVATQRFDIYKLIHKGLRNFMTDTLAAVGRMDVHDGDEVAAALTQVRDLLALCRTHAALENKFLHPALEARGAGSAARAAQDHETHEPTIRALEDQALEVARAEGAARAAAGLALYRGLAQFVGENFAHMQLEESAHNAALWAAYSDEELVALNAQLVASVDRDTMALVLRWMVPSINPAERAGLLSEMQRKAPADAFRGVLALIRPTLGERDWTKLMAALAPSYIDG
jgi:hypothetical protein